MSKPNKNNITELTKKVLDKLLPHLANTNSFLLESMGFLKEAQLNPNNAVPIKGSIDKGEFQVGDVIYSYNFVLLPKDKILPGDKSEVVFLDKTYDVNFHVKGDTSSKNRKGKENLTKIYTTMYKIILDFCKDKQPNYLLISSFDDSGYFSAYSTLTQTHKIPGYNRKTIIYWEYPNQGKITSILMKKI